ncbi:MAG: thioredoxin domain-containing protein [Synechococcales bacterium]|nr:thioredoxin domain-containing protein [Synechococcales bacterium]
MPNRLAQSPSLYLRKHADNPIDWWPWCDEALEKAAQENKPIFLSIGYSSCHWCTVMEGEAFSDRAIAQYMNDNFVPIKVDREERPDIDSIYMQALQMMTGHGGWPLNVFLSPQDRIPFYGGTYFPVQPKYGQPGFLQVLQALRNFHDTETEKLDSIKGQIFEQLQGAASLAGGESLEPDLLEQGLDYSAGVLSAAGPGPRFPMIPYADAALHGTRQTGGDRRYNARILCQQRGMDLALGGIYDHVGGGFHRYTVDPTWTVPHFEKMLYDNGQIMEYLANLWSLGIEELAFERAIAGTVGWLKREMTAAEGYFYAAQDADSFATPQAAEPEEGTFYVWDYTELSSLLSDGELTELAAAFIITANGNFEGKTVLQRQKPGPVSPDLERVLAKLYRVRYGHPPETAMTVPPARNNREARETDWPGRIPAVTDTKMIVAWNSLMISGLARAAAVFQRSPYYHLAAAAAQFILDHQWVGGRFHRLNYDGTAQVLAQSEDYALFIKALLDLHQGAIALLDLPATHSPTWLEQAHRVQAEFDEWLWSVELGGYFNTASDASGDLVVRERSYSDNATPSANGVAIANLVRLALLTENLAYLDKAEQALTAFSGIMVNAPQACPSLFAALDWFRHPTLVRTTPDRVVSLAQQYHPTVVCQVETALPEGSIGLVCEGLSCQEPAQTWEQMQEQVRQAFSAV